MILPIQSRIGKGSFYKILDGVCPTRSDYIVIRLILLKYEPHGFYIFRSVSPVSHCIKITEVQLLLLPGENPGNGASDLPCNKNLSSPWTLVIEQNAVTSN